MAFVSVIAGTLSVIASFVFNWFAWYYTFIISIVGIATGIVGVKRFGYNEVSRAGIILSVVGIFLTIIFLIAYNILLSYYQTANI